MDMILNEFKYLTSTCWNEKYQPLTFDMTKDRYQGRYRLGLTSLFVPNSSPCSKYLQLELSHMFKYTCIYTWVYLQIYE